MSGSPLQTDPHPAGSPPAPKSWSPTDLHRLARGLFPSGTGSLTFRLLQHYRPFICPFDALIPLIPADSRVLDVGCGGGLWLGLLAATGRLAEGVGFDSSTSAISLAQQMRVPASHAGKLRFEHRGVQDPWPDGLFDVVSIIDVMHHVPLAHQAQVIDLAASRVAQGGLLIYKDMCRRPAWRALANRAHDLVMARQWIHYAPVEKVSTWAVSAGLRCQHAGSLPRWWYGHELRVFVKT